ncbi:unnamed protein product [Parnassius apollo]|uniref:(apollo) hypothetical protein n=1 Tax=Parnassius apollo TaxID=110799 RepID=A0A8S3XT03_PARAO|nr:unnamed protein product [Parnassius apollo]
MKLANEEKVRDIRKKVGLSFDIDLNQSPLSILTNQRLKLQCSKTTGKMDIPLKGCTLHDAFAALEDDEDLEPSYIFIETPDPSMHTDEESADEDQSGLIKNLSGRSATEKKKYSGATPCSVHKL